MEKNNTEQQKKQLSNNPQKYGNEPFNHHQKQPQNNPRYLEKYSLKQLQICRRKSAQKISNSTLQSTLQICPKTPSKLLIFQ
jgi:hypothetical protein